MSIERGILKDVLRQSEEILHSDANVEGWIPWASGVLGSIDVHLSSAMAFTEHPRLGLDAIALAQS